MKFTRVREVMAPTRGTERSAGIDFYVPRGIDTSIAPGMDILIPSGIKAEIRKGYMLMAADKSGVVSSKFAQLGAGLQPKYGALESPVIIGAKIVDEDYQGEIHIHLINVGKYPIRIKQNMKIAQFILVPVLYEELQEVESFELFSHKSERGEGNFGSTGK